MSMVTPGGKFVISREQHEPGYERNMMIDQWLTVLAHDAHAKEKKKIDNPREKRHRR